MENRFYIIRYPEINKYDIEIINFDNKIFDQSEADQAFLTKLSKVAILSRGSKREVWSFLSHHFDETKASKKEFLDHTEEIFKPYESELKPFNYAIGHVYDWLKIKRKEFGLEPEKIIKPKTTVKESEDPSYDEIIKDRVRMDKIIQSLKIKDFVEEDLTWKGSSGRRKKTELVALIEFLEKNNIIKREPRALLGRIFSKKFNCPMNPRNYSQSPKDHTTEQIESALKNCL